MKTNNNSFELNTFNTQDFPESPKIIDSETVNINRTVLMET
jgi:DNA polymerase III sliding clamp (beta) subunit (PCNA family)